MIQLRKTDGSVMPVPKEGVFVELVSDDGTIGMVFFQTPGMIVQINPGSIDAARYEDMFRPCGVKFNKILVQRK
jgi:hypothetical protein